MVRYIFDITDFNNELKGVRCIFHSMPTVSKNIFWSVVTSLLQLYTGSVVFIVLSKMMSVEDFGILSFGFALSALAIIVADFGFSLMVIKDYPQRESGHANYVSNGIIAKMFLAASAAFLFLLYLTAFYDGNWFKVGALYIVFATVASFVIYLQAVLKAQNRFQKFTESTIIYALAATVSVLIFWQFKISLFQLVLLLLISKMAQLIWTFALCKTSFTGFSFDGKLVKRLIKNSWSFGMHTILGIFYFMVDTQIISLYLGAKEVALYQSVFRIIFILLVLSDVVSNVLLPYLSYKFYKGEDLSELVSKIFLFLLIIGCSLFLLFTSFKVEILTLLYTSEYQEAAILVLPLSIVVILRTVSSLLGNILTVSDKQVYRVITVSISLAVSLILNFILIPKYGILAASWVSVLVHSILFSLYFIYSRREVASIRLFSFSNLLILTTTVIIYALVNHFFDGNIWVVLCGVLLWGLVIVFVMNRDNNFRFLQTVLKEKGVG